MKITDAQVAPLLKEYGIDQEKTHAKRIVRTYNLKEAESSSINEFKSKINNIKNTIASQTKLIGNINSISEKHGADSIIRLKGGKFKSGNPDNLMKKLLNGSRYEAERNSAAKYIGISSGHVTASKGQQILSMNLENAEQSLKDLNDKKENAENESKKLGMLFDKLTEQSSLVSYSSNSKENEKGGGDKVTTRRDFSLIYQSNAGCAAINNQARKVYGNSSGLNSTKASGILDEYKKAFGDNIFGKSNDDIKQKIKHLSSNIPDLVKSSAEAYYTPSKNDITTMRGCGMTEKGIADLIKGKDNKTIYRLPQFFSTTSNKDIANQFAEANSGDDKAKVLFTVKGNSSNPVIVKNYLKFGDNEHEKLYSPLAHFVVTHASQSGDEYRFVLQEVKKADNAEVFPH
ncbi:ADP-ribosyltransferase domain-containing protein [Vibrio sp. CUB2]|uniref:ADP-ribosyltransferase domain-containing protein n=1 Tax=Vibrio sp. CUB2 TaxID=2315233 RepID=UPI00076AA9F3|nr:ADP-ribosyltransferase domain-containing protein [Vibrio sp. CUB2]